MTPEQRADQERERIIELLIPEMVQDEDWPFDSDADATRQIASCWADEVVMTLGLDSEELESLLARDSDSQNPLERLVQDLPDQGVELGFSILGCFEDNARKTDFLKLMSGSDSTRTTLTTISWKADEEAKILDGQVDWDGSPIETTTSIAATTSTTTEITGASPDDTSHLYGPDVEQAYMQNCLPPLLAFEQTEVSEEEWVELSIGVCGCAYERITKEISYYVFLNAPEGSITWREVDEIQDQCGISVGEAWASRQ